MSFGAEAKASNFGTDDTKEVIIEHEIIKHEPQEISLELIIADPGQPRKNDNPGFTQSSLDELAETIKARGVKSPISVRSNPEKKGHFIINHGERRFRASFIAGKKAIPAFIDNSHAEIDQIIENLQRAELTARELADFIGRQLSAGKKKSDVAKMLGKSNAFITQHVVLLDLPDVLNDAFNSGKVNDLTVINELVKIYKKHPQKVEEWLLNNDEITRSNIKLLPEFIASEQEDSDGSEQENSDGSEQENSGEFERDPNTVDFINDGTDSETSRGSDKEPLIDEDGYEIVEFEPPVKESKDKPPADPEKIKRAIVVIKHDDRLGRIILDRRPPAAGQAWFKYDDDGHEFVENLVDVELVEIREG